MNTARAAGVPSWKLPTPPGDYCFCSSQLPAIKTTLLVSGVGGVEKLLPSAPANSPQVPSWKLPTLPRVAVSAAHNFQLSKPRCVQDSVTGMSINLARPTRSNRAVKIGLFLAGSYPHPLGLLFLQLTTSSYQNHAASQWRGRRRKAPSWCINTNPQVLSWKLPTPLGATVSAAHNFQLSKPRSVQDSNTTKADSSASQRLPHGAETTEIGGQWNIISSIFVMGLWAIMGSATALYALKRVSPYPPSSRSRG